MNAKTSYVIDLMSKDFDPILGVREKGQENLIAGNDDGGEGLNSRLTFTPKKDGEYELLFGSLDRQPGDFTVTVSTIIGLGKKEKENNPK